jgi:hypothetical protein
MIGMIKKYLKYKINELPEQEADIPKPDTMISGEQKKLLPGLIRTLETYLLPKYEVVSREKQIDNIEIFGKELLAFGEANSIQMVIDHAKKICLYVSTFEIYKLLKTLNDFPELIKELKVMINEK